jgi:hypothetical protein
VRILDSSDAVSCLNCIHPGCTNGVARVPWAWGHNVFLIILVVVYVKHPGMRKVYIWCRHDTNKVVVLVRLLSMKKRKKKLHADTSSCPRH